MKELDDLHKLNSNEIENYNLSFGRQENYKDNLIPEYYYENNIQVHQDYINYPDQNINSDQYFKDSNNYNENFNQQDYQRPNHHSPPLDNPENTVFYEYTSNSQE